MIKKNLIVIGNFDGIHLGHQALLSHARAIADQKDLNLGILTFSPHPRQVFQPHIAPFRLTPDDVKADLFMTMIKPDDYIVLPFDENLMTKTPQDFIDDILIARCNAAVVMAGTNFCFGHNREGTMNTLANCDAFETITFPLTEIDGARVSSTRIREHLKSADIKQANTLLGHDWYIQSEVVHGDKRGRELGYPTANMHFGEGIVPSHGVYAVWVQIEGEDIWRKGAANIGIRPMFETAMPMLETHLLDFDGDLYGKTLKVKPVQKLRDEMKFDGLDDLVTQIDADCAAIKEILV